MSDKILEVIESKHSEYPAFVKWLRTQRAIRDRTIGDYIRQLEYMRKRYGFNPSRKKADVLDIINSMAESGKVSSNTMNYRRHVLKFWLQFKGVKVNGQLETALRKKSATRKRKLRPEDLLTLEDVRDIADNTPSMALSAYFFCLWDCGCRPNELASLKVEDVSEVPSGRTFAFTFRETKNVQSKRTVLLIEPEARTRFMHYWATLPRDDIKAPVFSTQRETQFRPAALTQYLKQQHEKRIGKTLNCYLFRFSRITQLLRDKVFTESEVRTRVGHRPGSRMLEKVYAILGEEDQRRAELRAMGIKLEENEKTHPVHCPNCGASNNPGVSICDVCKHPLTAEESVRQQRALISPAMEDMQLRLADLQKEQDELKEYIAAQQSRDVSTRMAKGVQMFKDIMKDRGKDPEKMNSDQMYEMFKDIRREKGKDKEKLDIAEEFMDSTTAHVVSDMLLDTADDETAHDFLQGLREEIRKEREVDAEMAKAAMELKNDPIALDKALKEISDKNMARREMERKSKKKK